MIFIFYGDIFQYFTLFFNLFVQKRGRAIRIKIYLANSIWFFRNPSCILKTLIISDPDENDKTLRYCLSFWGYLGSILFFWSVSRFSKYHYIHIYSHRKIYKDKQKVANPRSRLARKISKYFNDKIMWNEKFSNNFYFVNFKNH